MAVAVVAMLMKTMKKMMTIMAAAVVAIDAAVISHLQQVKVLGVSNSYHALAI